MGSKKIQPQTSKKKEDVYSKKKIQIGISTSKFLIWEKKFSCQPQKCELEICMSNGSEVLIYLSFLLFHKEWIMLNKSLILDFIFNFSWKHPKFAKAHLCKTVRQKASKMKILRFYCFFNQSQNSYETSTCDWMKQLYWLSTRLLYKSTLVQSLDVFDFSFNRPWPVWQYGLLSCQPGVQN